MDKVKEKKAFDEWRKADGYKFKPESDEEADWVNVVKWWTWKAWEARAAKEKTCDACKDSIQPDPLGYDCVCLKCGREW